MFVTITFRSFTPTPGGLEFKPGKDYYFITTSYPNNLHNRYGGRCISHGMKVIFKVVGNADSVVPSDRVNPKKRKKQDLKRRKYGLKSDYDRNKVKITYVKYPVNNKASNVSKNIKLFQTNSHLYRNPYHGNPYKNKKYSKLRENEVLEYEEISVEASRMHHSGASSHFKNSQWSGKPKNVSFVLSTIAMYLFTIFVIFL